MAKKNIRPTTRKRTKIPQATAADVMFKSDLQCCVCQKKGDHIHHLNGRENNDFDNLALLCYDHHKEATITGSLSKTLSKETIRKFRELHYQNIAAARQRSIEVLNKPLVSLTQEDLLTASKNALIIMELENIKEKYIESSWADKGKALGQIFKFSDHSNHRIALEVFNFLEFVAAQTRAGLTIDAISTILSLILEFSPRSSDDFREQVEEISKIGIHIGDNIVYDSAIHVRDLEIAMYGLTILKFFYRSAKKNQWSELLAEIDRTYNELKATLSRPERNDLGDARELVEIFKSDLDNPDLSFPPLPDHLMKAVRRNQKVNSRIK